MAYQVVLTTAAQRQLERMPDRLRRQVLERIQGLADEPRAAGVKPLKGKLRGLYRIRSGDFRVIYRIEDKRLVVVIVEIVDRKDAYR